LIIGKINHKATQENDQKVRQKKKLVKDQ